jgi:hypothetical protein
MLLMDEKAHETCWIGKYGRRIVGWRLEQLQPENGRAIAVPTHKIFVPTSDLGQSIRDDCVE